MAEILIGALSALIALGAALTGYAAHRHQVRRNRELDDRERRVEDRERHAEERALAAERREALVQASAVSVDVRITPSRLHDGWLTAELVVRNGSDQPLRDLAVHYRGEALGDGSGGLGPGGLRSCPLPLVDRNVQAWDVLPHAQVDFTDAADNRWRREAGGSLRRGSRRLEDGTWEWGERQEPIVRVLPPVYGQPQPGAGYPAAGSAPARSKASCVVVAALAFAALGAAVIIWMQFR